MGTRLRCCAAVTRQRRSASPQHSVKARGPEDRWRTGALTKTNRAAATYTLETSTWSFQENIVWKGGKIGGKTRKFDMIAYIRGNTVTDRGSERIRYCELAWSWTRMQIALVWCTTTLPLIVLPPLSELARARGASLSTREGERRDEGDGLTNRVRRQ